MNISSIVVKTTPQHFGALKERIAKIKDCEIYLDDEALGYIIVVLEAKTTEQEIAINKQISSLQGVISANMHYTYQEDELDNLSHITKDASLVLNDETLNITDIGYNGALKSLKH